jgi:hypothetical protein
MVSKQARRLTVRSATNQCNLKGAFGDGPDILWQQQHIFMALKSQKSKTL